MIKEIPMLFSTPMVQAILEGRKNQTRRILKDKHVLYSLDVNKVIPEYFKDGDGGWCPYGKPGDVLWVRETFSVLEPEHCIDMDKRFAYKASCCAESEEIRKEYVKCGWPYTWKPSIHMPKEAARIWLQVESVRVERLQDISEADAIAEGVQPNCAGVDKCPSQYCQRMGCQCTGEYYHYQRDLDDFPAYSAKESFESLWQSINGADSWKANPWVWVISFKVLSTTGKPDLNNLQKH